MTSNPYAPPVAPVEDVSESPIAAVPRRPLSVWTFQVISAFMAAILLLMALSPIRPRLEAGGYVLGAVVLVVAIVGNQRRWRIARWAGLAMIAMAFCLLAWLNEELMKGRFAREAHGLTGSQLMMHLVLACVTLLPAGFWFWHFGFSLRSAHWFAPPGVAAKPVARP